MEILAASYLFNTTVLKCLVSMIHCFGFKTVIKLKGKRREDGIRPSPPLKAGKTKIYSVQWFSDFLVYGTLYTLKNYAGPQSAFVYVVIFIGGFAFEIKN